MGIDSFLSSDRKKASIAMIVIFVGLLADFIVTIVWWDRISIKYGIHAIKEGKLVWNSVVAAWVFSLVGAIFIGLFAVFALFDLPVCDSVTSNSMITMVLTIIGGCLSVASIVTCLIAASHGVDTPTIEKLAKDPKKAEKNLCLKYIFTLQAGVENWSEKNCQGEGKCKDLQKYFEKIEKKSGNKKFSYFCKEVAIPTLVFAIVQFAGLILFIVFLAMEGKTGVSASDM
ncbi:hypothetical protein M9Y10_040156 [Tritrichomonas musculus]|uniref:Tetraspanin family protein n=1 Tax=Tritrichomonas musculus TaxID=1915356 RepID=A0ABR2GPW8_9EUKA